MPNIIEGPPEPGAPEKPLVKRIGWFAMLWLGSLAATFAVVTLLRTLVH